MKTLEFQSSKVFLCLLDFWKKWLKMFMILVCWEQIGNKLGTKNLS
ncbi:hypothetical protein HMPREF1987_01092 [Peptostreptococcaceae bacterium oral taxon 113 str. W5053]|nr:hypothetical protein HMPREF1987_01092 [Peptostreptococcaceae bacterium oral taxon 113 str. W5053]